jgi:hypothetical protein
MVVLERAAERVRENLGMRGSDGPQRDLMDVQSVTGHLLPPGSVFEFLSGQRNRWWPRRRRQGVELTGPGGLLTTHVLRVARRDRGDLADGHDPNVM